MQAVYYLLFKVQPDFPARDFIDADNNFALDKGVNCLLQCFYANFPTQQEQESILKFVMEHAIEGKETIMAQACEKGFDQSLVPDDKACSGSARNDPRHGFPNALRSIASPQWPSKSHIALDQEYAQMQKATDTMKQQIHLLKRTKELQHCDTPQKYLKHQHVPQGNAACITEANPSLAARHATVEQTMKEAIESWCNVMTQWAQEEEETMKAPTSQAKSMVQDLQENQTSKQAVAQLQTHPKGQQQATSFMVNNLPEAQAQLVAQENRTPKKAVIELQTHPEADFGNAKEAQEQHKGQQEATSLKVATTVNILSEAQAPLVAQENQSPNQAVTELQTQAEATTLMVAQTDEAQAQAEGQQQERQDRILQATLSGASDDTL